MKPRIFKEIGRRSGKSAAFVALFSATKKEIWPPPSVEIAYLITSLSEIEASPFDLLKLNRAHWGIEIMHRNKDVFLGEDGCTSRKDNAPHVLFILNNLVLSILASVSSSPTQALEYFQDNKNRAIRHFT